MFHILLNLPTVRVRTLEMKMFSSLQSSVEFIRILLRCETLLRADAMLPAPSGSLLLSPHDSLGEHLPPGV